MIKFVYFDIGGVVVQDFSGTRKWEELKKELGVTAPIDSKFEEIWDSYSDVHCTTYDVDNLIPELNRKLKLNITQNYSLLMAFVDKFEQNRKIWPILSEAKKNYGVGLITNMYVRMFDKLLENNLMPPIEWDVVVDSTIVKLQKPDPKIYLLAEKECGFSGDEILFVENTVGHIKAAKKLGWQTFLYDSKNIEKSNKRLIDLLKL